MLKLLLTAGIIWFIYRFFIASPPSLGGTSEPEPPHVEDNNDEYVDYEEVE